jgi:hypothetical protein
MQQNLELAEIYEAAAILIDPSESILNVQLQFLFVGKDEVPFVGCVHLIKLFNFISYGQAHHRQTHPRSGIQPRQVSHQRLQANSFKLILTSNP